MEQVLEFWLSLSSWRQHTGNGIRETIANFNPHEDKKIDFCNMVEQLYQSKELENIFEGFQRTITKIEQFFL